MKNLDLSVIQEKAKSFFLKYYGFIFIISILCLYSGIIFRINQLALKEPSEEQIAEKLDQTKGPKIDQNSINKIEQLQDESVAVQGLFKEARDNPFNEE